MASGINNRNVLSKHKRTTISSRNTDAGNGAGGRKGTVHKVIKIVNLVVVGSNGAANLNSLFTANGNNTVNMTFLCKTKGAGNNLGSRTVRKLGKNKAFDFAVNQRLHNLAGKLGFVEHRVHDYHITRTPFMHLGTKTAYCVRS